MNRRALLNATLIGLVLQLGMVFAGHINTFVRMRLFAVLGMAISLVAGVLYAALARSSRGHNALGGCIAGGLCALIGIAVSHLLGDVPAFILVAGTLSSCVTGAIGGVAGPSAR